MTLRSIAAVLVTVLSAIIFSCSKEGKFIGDTNYQTELRFYSYTSGQNAYIKIQIGDTLIEKFPLNASTSLDLVLQYNMKTPKGSKAKLKIWWKNTSQLITDTTITVGSITNLYLIQYDPLKKHQFYTNFGSEGNDLGDTLKVQTRFIYTKDTALNYPDTVRIKFTTLYDINGDYAILNPDDTAEIYAVDGIVSDYIPLKNTKYKVEGSNNELYSIAYGYEIFNPKTGAKLEGFCFNIVPINVIDFSSATAGYLQTVRLGYVGEEAGGYVCNGATFKAQNNYDLAVLFGTEPD